MKINPKFQMVALLAAKEAGKVLQRHFKNKTKISFKRDLSLVTDIDVEAEKVIIALIKKHFPSHGILAEEKGGKVMKEYTWVIDPLDGTTNYTVGMPLFAVSIALLYQRKPVLGIIFNPISRELYFAEIGKGAYLNGKRMKIGRQTALSRAVIAFGRGREKQDFTMFQNVFRNVGQRCRTQRAFGAATLQMSYVASGRLDGFISAGSKPWDYAAGVLMAKEAGGEVTDFKGKAWHIYTKNIVAANRKIHTQLLNLMQ